MSLNCAVFDMESQSTWPETVEAKGDGAVKDEEELSELEEEQDEHEEVLLAHHHLWFVMI